MSVSRITLACNQQIVSNAHESLRISKCNNTRCQKLKILSEGSRCRCGKGRGRMWEDDLLSDSRWNLREVPGLMRRWDIFWGVLTNIWNEAQGNSVVAATIRLALFRAILWTCIWNARRCERMLFTVRFSGDSMTPCSPPNWPLWPWAQKQAVTVDEWTHF